MPSGAIEPRYERVACCPLCRDHGRDLGVLRLSTYWFGGSRIARPAAADGAIPVARCTNCQLIFKRLVPAREDLLRVLEQCGADVWRDRRGGRQEEVRWIRQHAPAASPDLLDIGSADGSLLAHAAKLGGRRRSALDVTVNDSCRPHVRGEYVLGFLEDELSWSGEPYDVVTAFDVLEHLYDPKAAFMNLARFVRPGGVVLAETGNAQSISSAPRWWYLNLFEHHMAWSPEAIEYAATEAGFEVVTVERVQQKDRARTGRGRRMAIAALRAMAEVPGIGAVQGRLIGRDGRLLADPWARDHMRVCLRRS